MVSFTKKQPQEQAISKFQAPSETEISIAQDQLTRLQEQVGQQHQQVSQAQEYLQGLTQSLQQAQATLASLQNQKVAAELEAQQSDFVLEMRSLADRINAASWELGQLLQEFQSRLNTVPGLQMFRGKQITMEAPDPQRLRRYDRPNYELLPFVFNQIGSNFFSLAFRSPLNPDQGDRLAALRQANGTDSTKG